MKEIRWITAGNLTSAILGSVCVALVTHSYGTEFPFCAHIDLPGAGETKRFAKMTEAKTYVEVQIGHWFNEVMS